MNKDKIKEWENSGHYWKLDNAGNMDYFAYTDDVYCNGPKCIRCGWEGCWHCNKIPPPSCEFLLKDKNFIKLKLAKVKELITVSENLIMKASNIIKMLENIGEK